jgi:putative DNA primase/helicase
VLEFIDAHGASRFEVWGLQGPLGPTRDRVGWRRRTDIGQDTEIGDAPGPDNPCPWEYFATPEGFREMCGGSNPQAVARELIRRGILQPDSNGKSARSLAVPGHGRKRLYHIRPHDQQDGGGDAD